MLLHLIGRCTGTHQMYSCNLAVGKGDEHTKTPSWFTTTKVYSLGEINSMKAESNVLAGQRETICHKERERERERERRERERERESFLFGFILRF